MYQPEVKWRFVERYCNPKNGWQVYVDIDASELGSTGGSRHTPAAIARQKDMQIRGAASIDGLKALGAKVGGGRRSWIDSLRKRYGAKPLPDVPGDRDIVAVNVENNKLLVAEAEGDSAGQPEQKLFKAIGQIVIGSGETHTNGYDTDYVIVVCGERVREHAIRAKALDGLGISALCIDDDEDNDTLLFGKFKVGPFAAGEAKAVAEGVG